MQQQGKQSRSGAGMSCARLRNHPCCARERSKARVSGHTVRHGSCQRKMGHWRSVRPRQGGAVLLTSAVAESGMRCVLKRSKIGAQGGGKQESKIEGVSYISDTQTTGRALGGGFVKPASSQRGDGGGGGGLTWARQTTWPWLREGASSTCRQCWRVSPSLGAGHNLGRSRS